MKFFDQKNHRLVYKSRSATPEFWDECWEDDEFKKTVVGVSSQSFVKKITKKYLQEGSRILEGGCGRGQYVYALQKWGYDSQGLDFAPKTVKKIQELFPELKVTLGDVRSLPFEDNSFDGYWSFGVIEHFYEGFGQIAGEMARVVRPNGFVFVTFPYFSPLRKMKSKFSLYPLFDENNFEKERFYQFALNTTAVKQEFQQYGLTLTQTMPLDGIKGLKDEVTWLRPVLQYIYNSKLFPMKVLRQAINILFQRLSGHSVLLIFENKK